MTEMSEHVRMVEALLFAATEPLNEDSLRSRLPDDIDLPAALAVLVAQYEGHGVNLVCISGKWSFRTTPDLAHILELHVTVPRRLSRAAVETLAIIAYHQPVTRAEIEEIRGVALSKGMLDTLFEAGWIKPKGRRRTPGRPITYGTTDDFLEHFGIESTSSLPGLDELRATGVLRREPPADMLRQAEARARQEADTAGESGRKESNDKSNEAVESASDSVIPLKRP